MTLLGCIADDFTGATDLAGLLARSGVPVSLRIGIPDLAPLDTAPLEVVALKCRTAPVAKAVAETRRALAWLQAAGATRFFWKYCSTFDSTPQGNIGPVAEALMQDLGTDQTTYCPAFPENGRAIFMGNLFVGRQPLSESPMKDHPLTPMRDFEPDAAAGTAGDEGSGAGRPAHRGARGRGPARRAEPASRRRHRPCRRRRRGRRGSRDHCRGLPRHGPDDRRQRRRHALAEALAGGRDAVGAGGCGPEAARKSRRGDPVGQLFGHDPRAGGRLSRAILPARSRDAGAGRHRRSPALARRAGSRRRAADLCHGGA